MLPLVRHWVPGATSWQSSNSFKLAQTPSTFLLRSNHEYQAVEAAVKQISHAGWLAEIIEHFLNIVKNDVIYACIPSRLNLKHRLLLSVPALLRSDTDFIGCTDCTKWVPAVLRLQAL